MNFLRPGFRPQAGDWLWTLGAMALVAVTAFWMYWHGLPGWVFLMLSVPAVAAGGPVALVLLLVFWRFRRPWGQAMARVALQGLFALALLVVVNWGGIRAYRWSLRTTRARAEEVVRRVEQFKAQQGRLPVDLVELGELPEPTVCPNFDYAEEGGEFRLSYRGPGIGTTWTCDSRTGRWHDEDGILPR